MTKNITIRYGRILRWLFGKREVHAVILQFFSQIYFCGKQSNHINSFVFSSALYNFILADGSTHMVLTDPYEWIRQHQEVEAEDQPNFALLKTMTCS